MGRRSVKENKNIYQQSREKAELTREEASERMEYISADRIEKLESGRFLPHPDEVLTMAECYKNAALCNYYCSHECPIGQKYVPSLEIKNISQITLEVINSLNALEKQKDRLIEITVDGKISEDEKKDFDKIREELQEITNAVQTLQIWVEHTRMEKED